MEAVRPPKHLWSTTELHTRRHIPEEVFFTVTTLRTSDPVYCKMTQDLYVVQKEEFPLRVRYIT
jgi:hypothetical protein